jgi:hypothetical protein
VASQGIALKVAMNQGKDKFLCLIKYMKAHCGKEEKGVEEAQKRTKFCLNQQQSCGYQRSKQWE